MVNTENAAGTPAGNGNAENVEKVNYLTQYNKLVAEAHALGHTEVKVQVARFRDNKTGAAKVAFLESRIIAFKKSNDAADKQQGPEVQPDQAQNKEETTEVAKSNQVRKAKKQPKVTKAKVTKDKVKAKSKKKAQQNARTKVEENRPGFVGDFGTRKGTFKDDLIQILEKANGKPTKRTDLIKKLYNGKGTDGALTMVLVGVQDFIDKKKLKYELVKDGRGEDATVALVKK